MTMTSTHVDTSHRATIEQELRQRVASARAFGVAATAGPLALRCRACGEVNGCLATVCRGCNAVFNAEVAWIPTAEATSSGEVR